MDNNLTFSKIVATPTLNSWSQAYNAGKLFAVLSLEKMPDATDETESLNILGKDLLERLEQEFFVIEDKNLESIKKAVSTVFEKEAKGVSVSFAAGAVVGNILYLFGIGNAKVYIKRGENLGLALNSEASTEKNIASSSGFLQEGDIAVLTTDAFSKIVTQDDLNLSLSDTEPTEITESLAPKVHRAENGNISAIVIRYKNPPTEPPVMRDGLDEVLQEGDIASEEDVDDSAETAYPENRDKRSFSLNEYFVSFKSKFRKSNIRPTKKVFLATAIIIIVILVSSISLGIREQNNAKVRALFNQVYPQATKKYDEGQSLLDLNKTYARDAFLSAQKILQNNEAKFVERSKEATQTQDLLKKIDEGLAKVSPIDKSGLDRSKLSVIVANGSGVEGTAGKGATILKDSGYNVTSTENADNFDYQDVTIKVKADKNNFLSLLKSDLAKDYTIKSAVSNLSPDSSADALVIIGK